VTRLLAALALTLALTAGVSAPVDAEPGTEAYTYCDYVRAAYWPYVGMVDGQTHFSGFNSTAYGCTGWNNVYGWLCWYVIREYNPPNIRVYGLVSAPHTWCA